MGVSLDQARVVRYAQLQAMRITCWILLSLIGLILLGSVHAITVRVSWTGFVCFFRAYTIDSVYGETDGSVFIPSVIVKRWVQDARKQLKDGEYVSTNDVVTAWIYKVRTQTPPSYCVQGSNMSTDWTEILLQHAFEIFPSCSTSVLTTVFTLCGRIPSIPQTFSNAATCYVNPALRTRHLRETSLPSLALQIRRQFCQDILGNPEKTLKYVAHRAQFEQTGELYIPCGRSSRDRCCFISSFANLGVSAPDFGNGRECVVAALYYTENITGFCSLLNDLDEQGSGWRMHGRMTR